MKAERGRYAVFHICVDMDEGGTDNVTEVRERLDAMEAEIRGFHLLGSDETETWPTAIAAATTYPRGEES